MPAPFLVVQKDLSPFADNYAIIINIIILLRHCAIRTVVNIHSLWYYSICAAAQPKGCTDACVSNKKLQGQR